MRLARHESRLMKTAQNEFLFARIAVDIANCENALCAALEFLRIDRDQILFEVQPPVSNRPELHCQTKKRKHDIALQRRCRTVLGANARRLQLAVLPVQFHDLTDQEIHLATLHQCAHLVH